MLAQRLRVIEGTAMHSGALPVTILNLFLRNHPALILVQTAVSVERQNNSDDTKHSLLGSPHPGSIQGVASLIDHNPQHEPPLLPALEKLPLVPLCLVVVDGLKGRRQGPP